MVSQEIYEQLVYFTDEEIDNLNGIDTIDKSIYLNPNSNVIDCNKLLEKNQQISVRKHSRFIKYPKHKHNYIELMYVYSGSMTNNFDDQSITINEGDLLLLNQNIEHSIEFCGQDDIIFNFIIRIEFFEFLSYLVEQENEVVNFLFNALYSVDNNGEFLVFNVSKNEKIRNYIESIITHIYEPELNSQIELKLLVGLLLAELMNKPEQIKSYQGNNFEKLILGSIKTYISTQFKEGSLQKLSKQIRQEDYKISKLIKNKTGHTFKQLIQIERTKAAAKLLRTTDLPIVDIIAEVGYENATYFYKIFKEIYGLTPNEYRNQI